MINLTASRPATRRASRRVQFLGKSTARPGWAPPVQAVQMADNSSDAVDRQPTKQLNCQSGFAKHSKESAHYEPVVKG